MGYFRPLVHLHVQIRFLHINFNLIQPKVIPSILILHNCSNNMNIGLFRVFWARVFRSQILTQSYLLHSIFRDKKWVGSESGFIRVTEFILLLNYFVFSTDFHMFSNLFPQFDFQRKLHFRKQKLTVTFN